MDTLAYRMGLDLLWNRGEGNNASYDRGKGNNVSLKTTCREMVVSSGEIQTPLTSITITTAKKNTLSENGNEIYEKRP